jgi:pilus assembly protein CpaE
MADMVTAQHLEQIIALGRRRYDYFVVDLGSHLDDNTLLFMDTATRIIIVLTPDIPAIKNARLFLEIAQNLDYDPKKIILALNQADSQETINAPAIERHLKHPVSISIPSYPRTTRTAINRGIPLSLYEREVNKEMPITRQLLALTEMIPPPDIDRDVPALASTSDSRSAPETKKKSRFGGLFKRSN